jgi:hypothetical protein
MNGSLRTVVVALSLALLTPIMGAKGAEVSRSNSRTVGNSRFGGSLNRSMFARHTGTRGTFACATAAYAKILGRTYRAARLARRVEGSALGSGANAAKFFQLEIIGRNGISIGVSFSHTYSVRTFEVPVPIGPFHPSIEGSVGLTIGIRGSIGSQGIVSVGLEGSASIGGTVGIGVGVPGAKVGVEGELALIKASLPATCTMRRTGVTFDVSFVVESSVEIKLFAKVGVGPFSKKWTVDVPFLKFTFARRTFPIASSTVRA